MALVQPDPGVLRRAKRGDERAFSLIVRAYEQPVYNYSREFPFIWEEMHIPISFRDDRQRAEEIILKAVRDNTQEIANLAEPELERLKERFFIESADIPPRIYLRTDNWVELSVRFLCPTHDIRDLKSRISRQILAGLDEAKIGIASGTYEVVGFPPIRVEGPVRIARGDVEMR